MKNDLRVVLTTRMLKEGLLRCMAYKTISKISVSDLCKEAGVNRATFYNHYDSPFAVLKAIAEDYAAQMREIYYKTKEEQKGDERKSIEACLEYLYERKAEVNILLSKNAENSVSGLGLNIITEGIKRNEMAMQKLKSEPSTDVFLYSVITASAAYGLIQVWLTMDMDKTPAEIMDILADTFGGRLFSQTSAGINKT